MKQAILDDLRHKEKLKLAARWRRKATRALHQKLRRRGEYIGNSTGGRWGASLRRNAGSSRSWR